jgi:hypothetical protein
MNSYDKGDLVRLTATFTNSAGVATDPTVVLCRVKSPTTTTIYTYNPGAIVKDATGVYYIDVSVSAVGQWWYRWEGAGTVEQADEGAFIVEASAF